eukprot:1387469-Amorphochlora_amoeboformis.AAC.2
MSADGAELVGDVQEHGMDVEGTGEITVLNVGANGEIDEKVYEEQDEKDYEDKKHGGGWAGLYQIFAELDGGIRKPSHQPVSYLICP